MGEALILWGSETPRTHRPVWILEELGIPYIHNPIGSRTGETQTSAFQTLSAKQKIPVLQHGDFTLTESVAISRYLISAISNDVFWTPQTLQDRAREDEWCHFIYGELDETGLYILRRHGDLASIYGGSPDVLASTKTYVERQLIAAAQLLDGRQTAMPGGFSLVDILLMGCVEWAIAYQVDVPDGLMDYRAVIAQRPAFQRSMKINYAKRLAAQNLVE